MEIKPALMIKKKISQMKKIKFQIKKKKNQQTKLNKKRSMIRRNQSYLWSRELTQRKVRVVNRGKMKMDQMELF